MLKFLLSFIFLCVNLYALSVSSNDDYKVIESKNYNIIYTPDYSDEVKFIKHHLDDFLSHNDESFGFTLDEPLRLVLVSDNIQIPNAFSTQIPFNLGIYFNGGSGMNDYFASKSWLTNLLVHEMVHNYHINAKKSEISKTLHKYLGNNFLPVITPVPLFTLPNLLLPTPLLEGNSVLNESIYNNGGRLHSGEHNALKNSIVFGESFDTTRFINDHLNFPYTTEKYIVGGFYMNYLASKYGLDKVNSFFYEHSIHSINPFLLNSTYKDHFGVSFDESVEEFISYTKKKYGSYKEADSEVLKSSKDQIYFSKIDNNIHFITTDLTTDKELNVYSIESNKLSSLNTSLKNAKVFKKGDKLLVSSSDFIDSTLFKHGLFDSDNYIDESTIGKDIKAIHNEKVAYVNIKESFLNTKLYINDEYYNEIASSAIFDDEGNIYYFKQNNDTRILYKNKKPIYEYKGYFGKLVDVMGESVYFIGNTKNGSTLYKLKNSKLYKVSSFENIVDGKLIDTNTLLASTITADGYSVQKIDISNGMEEKVVHYSIIDEKNSFSFSKEYTNQSLDFKDYNELSQLQFSFLYPYFSYDSEEGSSYMIDAVFMDPIMFNMLDIYAYKDNNDTKAGMMYINERYIPFSLNIYDMNRDLEYLKERGYGASLEVYGPLYKKGRHLLEVSLKHYLDDKNEDKNPTVLSLNHIYKKGFLLEDSPYLLSDISALVKEDRGDLTLGADLKYNKHLFSELYFNMQAKVVDSDTKTIFDQRGIEVEKDYLDTLNDKSTVFMEGADNSFFVKDITKLSVGLSKTFHISKYFYNFPISLRKESIFYRHNRFDFTTINDHTVEEDIFGVKFDLLWVHKLPIPATIKYIKNDSSVDDYKITFTMGVGF